MGLGGQDGWQGPWAAPILGLHFGTPPPGKSKQGLWRLAPGLGLPLDTSLAVLLSWDSGEQAARPGRHLRTQALAPEQAFTGLKQMRATFPPPKQLLPT